MAEHVRIDEGIRRGRRLKPHQVETAERQARSGLGQFLTPYTPEQRQQAVQAALIALETGSETVEQIADKHVIPRATMYSWLVGTEASQARTRFFDEIITRAAEQIETARTPLDLTRAREGVAAWIKVAERRDPRAYGQQQVAVQVNANGPVTVQIVSFAASAQTPVIEGTCVEQDVMSKASVPSVLPSPSSE